MDGGGLAWVTDGLSGVSVGSVVLKWAGVSCVELEWTGVGKSGLCWARVG